MRDGDPGYFKLIQRGVEICLLVGVPLNIHPLTTLAQPHCQPESRCHLAVMYRYLERTSAPLHSSDAVIDSMECLMDSYLLLTEYVIV